MRTRLVTILIVANLIGCAPSDGDQSFLSSVQEARQPIEAVANKKLLITYQGMGTFLTWAIGASFAAYESLAAVRNNEVVLTGNSGGSVIAAYMACHGFNPTSLQGSLNLMLSFPAELVNEDQTAKAAQILKSELTNDPTVAVEFDNAKIVVAINDVIGDDCRPNLPLVIASGNVEVNERRNWKAYLNLRPYPRIPNKDAAIGAVHKNRVFDQLTYTVTEDGEPIGKACTYFASRSLFEALQALPPEQRLCDLRLIETAQEMRHAVLASISETTYYAPWPEQVLDDPSGKLTPQPDARGAERATSQLVSEGRLIKSFAERQDNVGRAYNGGVLLPGISRDILRILPALKSMGTGRTQYSSVVGSLLRRWYGYDVNSLVYQEQMNLDLQVRVPQDMHGTNRPANQKDLKATYVTEIERGYETTKACFSAPETCLPIQKLKIVKLPAQGIFERMSNPVADQPLPNPDKAPRWDLPVSSTPRLLKLTPAAL